MLSYDSGENIGYSVVTTGHALEQSLSKERVRRGITFRQRQVLVLLSLEDESSQAVSAGWMKVEAPTLASIPDRMERVGRIVPRFSPSDQHTKIVRAKPVRSRMVASEMRFRDCAVQGIESDELDLLKDIPAKIQENLLAANLVQEMI